ncbi:MAG: DUF3494 domain-containing protein [Halomonadaceae bacterium]|nr:MAG: DUF3494 domain-containing protein [Halomonadaceae bacterium]
MHIAKTYTKSTTGLFLFLSTLLLFGCSSDSDFSPQSGTPGGTDPVAALAVTSTAPADEATEVGTNVKVVAVFNKAMASETIDGASFTLQGETETAITGTFAYNPETLSATLDPGPLSNDELYTATITTSVQTDSGESLQENFTWTFKTSDTIDETDPTVASSRPQDGGTDVALNTRVSIVFSKAIDPKTVTSGAFVLSDDESVEVSGSLRYVNTTTVEFTPSANLAADTAHTMTLSESIEDIAGNPLGGDLTIGFMTGTKVAFNSDAVDLASAGNYVILAKTGVSTEVGTEIIGDVAVSPESRTALTGFGIQMDASGKFAESSLVTGQLFAADMTDPTPIILTTAIADMQLAYNDAAGRLDPDETELGAGNIGGLTLSPGLYKWSTGVLIPSDVTLSGSSDDVWIFQIGEDLKLEDDRSIILSGGAQAKNVFWQVAGEVTLQPNTTFEGIILSKTTIIMKSEAVLNGRALAQTAVTLIANDVNQPAN